MRKNSKRASGANRARPKKIRGEERLLDESNGHFGKLLDGPLTSLMESLAVGVAVATRDGNLLYTNSCFLETLGQSPRKFASGSNLKSFVSAASWAPLEEAMSRIRVMYRDSGGVTTDYEKAVMKRIERVDVALAAVAADILPSLTVKQALEYLRTYRPAVYIPAHHDADYNGLWRPTEPIFQALKDEDPSLITVSEQFIASRSVSIRTTAFSDMRKFASFSSYGRFDHGRNQSAARLVSEAATLFRAKPPQSPEGRDRRPPAFQPAIPNSQAAIGN